MNNKQRQTRLDKEKYLASEQAQTDLSGKMPYCAACTNENPSGCEYTQEQREQGCICAKAYNRGREYAKKRNV